MPITLKKETRQRAEKALKDYLNENHDLDIGDLRATLFLDFLLKTIGPGIYNQAISDAGAFMADKLIDLESSLYEPETAPDKS